MRRDYVQLAHTYEEYRQSIAGWFVSEKMDGQRAFWDGGISRGLPAKEVPYANSVKDARYIQAPICTGLFSRYGNILNAPYWWLDDLPSFCLDGELWIKRNSFQDLSKIIKKIVPGDEWEDVKYMVFDSPIPSMLFKDGEIKVQNYKINLHGCFPWWTSRGGKSIFAATFTDVLAYLTKNLGETENLKLHKQTGLPFNTDSAIEMMSNMLEEVTNNGGEGLVLRKPSSMWDCKRVYTLLKVKKFLDAEGVVTGYITGKETDKGSKLLGLMGSLILRYEGKRLDLSGFKESERIFDSDAATRWAENNPGSEVPEWISNPLFPRGSVINFRYRELTDALIPKEARFNRRLT